jgi:predicted nuclease of restriction endonuclease-like (RecB) superfamily
VKGAPAEPIETSFSEVVSLIEQARTRAYQAVNSELVGLYWQIGQYISRKLDAAEWGAGVVDHLARHLDLTLSGLRGFTARNLFRMRQFYDAYAQDKKVSALLTQLPWTHNLIILGQSKRQAEREFHLRRCVEERWSSRELERQFRLALFERTVLHPPKLSPAVREFHGTAAGSVFRDAYFVEFLDLPTSHTEGDLHWGLLPQAS